MTIEEDKQLLHPEYWNDHYAAWNSETPTHEWFRSFTDLESFFQRNLFEAPGLTAEDDPKILHLGSGDSIVPAEFASRGYKRQLCVDFSPVVIERMSERHKPYKGIEWKQVDIRNMPEVGSKTINVAFDKATLDAMIYGSPWNPPDEVRDNLDKYLKEIHRVLTDDGIFLYITFRQPHFMKVLLNPDNIWDLEMQVLEGKGVLDYYGYVIRKSSTTRIQ